MVNAAEPREGAVGALCGSARSHRSPQIDAWLDEQRGLLVVRTPQQARARGQALLKRRGGAWGEPVMTWGKLAHEILRAEGRLDPPVPDAVRRTVMQCAVAQARAAGALDDVGAGAATPGFVDHVLRLVNELKQAAIEPEAFADATARDGERAALHRAVAAIYTAYQDLLRTKGAYDRIGVFWEAALVCKRKRPALFDTFGFVAFDGIDGLTPSDLRLLEAVRPHVDRLMLGLNTTENPAQGDLYALQRRTLGALRETFPAMDLRYAAEPDAATTTGDWLSGRLLVRSDERPPGALRQTVTMTSCGGADHEVEVAARRVKQLLREGVGADRIAVVHPDVAGALGMVERVFREFGIPCAPAVYLPVGGHSLGGFLVDAIEATGDYDRETVLRVVVSPWFRHATPSPIAAEAASAFGALSRAAGIVRGTEEWDRRCRRLMEALERDEPPAGLRDVARRVANARASAEALREAFERLADLAAGFRDAMAPGDWAHAAAAFLAESGAGAVAESIEDSGRRRTARAVCAAMHRGLSAYAEWHDESGAARGELERAAFLEDLRRLLEGLGVPAEAARGGVAVLEPRQMQGVQYDHVFFLGLNEGALPKPFPRNGIYLESDVAALGRLGLRFARTEDALDRQLAEFHHVIAGARDSLYLSCRTLDEQGREQRESPFVDDVERCLRGGLAREHVRAIDFVPPEGGETACWRDIANRACRGGAAGAAILAVLGGEPAIERAARGAAAQAARWRPGLFDGWDAILPPGSGLEAIGAAFGPDHEWSAGQLQAYVDCPFQFFMRHGLHIDEPDEPDECLDPKTRGQIIHRTLEAIYREAGGHPVAAWGADTALARLDEVFEGTFASWTRGHPATRGVLEAERRRWLRRLREYLVKAAAEEGWTPARFELSFGERAARDGETPAPCALELDGERVRLTGRIDRVDVSASDEKVVRVVDYKTGAALPTPPEMARGESLQGPLYGLVLQEALLPGTRCTEARFEGLRDVRPSKGPTRQSPWETALEAASRAAAASIRGVRAGWFPPAPRADQACRVCAGSRPCRYEKRRIEQKERPGA